LGFWGFGVLGFWGFGVSGGGRMTSVVSGGGATTGTLATACTVLCTFPTPGSPANLSAKKKGGGAGT